MILKSKKLKMQAVGCAIFSILLFSSLPLFTFFHGSSLQQNSRTIKELPSTSDTLSLEWYKTWGTSDDYDNEDGHGIALDASGNVYITGTTTSYGAGYEDVLLLKYNSSGNLLWYKTWGGYNYDYGRGIAVDGSGNAFITGSTDSYGTGNNNVFLLKYDSSGNLLWYKTWGSSENAGGSGIALDSSGNIFITGSTYSYGAGNRDTLVLKYDSSGSLLWNKTWGGSGDDWGNGIALDGSGNAFITGFTDSYGTGNNDAFLLKYNSSGNLLWYKTWGGSDRDYGYEIALDGLGKAYITGVTYSYGLGNSNAFLLKYDSFGNLLWYKTWGGDSYGDYAYGYGIAVDGSGNTFITGTYTSYGPYDVDGILLKYDSSGDLLWEKTWEVSDDDSGESGFGIALDALGNAFITGETYNYGEFDVSLLKYGVDIDEDGLTDGWEVKYGLNATWSGDASLDGDNDGLTNLEEFKINIDPTDSDTDDDGLSDGDEVKIHGTDPNDSDTDGDGFSDSQEIQIGTDPLSALSNLFITLTIIIVIGISVGAVSLVIIIIYRKRKISKVE